MVLNHNDGSFAICGRNTRPGRFITVDGFEGSPIGRIDRIARGRACTTLCWPYVDPGMAITGDVRVAQPTRVVGLFVLITDIS